MQQARQVAVTSNNQRHQMHSSLEAHLTSQQAVHSHLVHRTLKLSTHRHLEVLQQLHQHKLTHHHLVVQQLLHQRNRRAYLVRQQKVSLSNRSPYLAVPPLQQSHLVQAPKLPQAHLAEQVAVLAPVLLQIRLVEAHHSNHRVYLVAEVHNKLQIHLVGQASSLNQMPTHSAEVHPVKLHLHREYLHLVQAVIHPPVALVQLPVASISVQRHSRAPHPVDSILVVQHLEVHLSTLVSSIDLLSISHNST